jgi:hypothetical protein
MVNLALSDAGMETVRIAIGDNLLSKPFASDLMRVNRSFIVKRSVVGRREKLENLKKLSAYIRHSITNDSASVWIAQREGRAKDGHDRTETALLKMLALSKQKEQSFAQATAELNLVPVAISYEYDPCDVDKGRELYAKEQGEDFLRRQRELMTAVVAEQDIIITTAAIPGAKSPILVTEDMVKAMKPGAVIVDLAAERGGNCDLTEQGKTVVAHDVTIMGPENVPSDLAYHASQMYGKNMQTLLELILDEQGNLNLDFNDEIVAGTVVAHQGDVPHPHMRKLLGLAELVKEQPESEAVATESK